MQPNQEQSGWDYRPSGAAVADRPTPQARAAVGGAQQPPSGAMVWTASEFIEHQRGASWYLMLIAGAVVLAAGAYFLFKDYFAVGVIAALAIIVAIAAGRRPQQIQYQLTNQGIQIGSKFYGYGSFRSFSVIRDGGLSSVDFMPLKKISLPVSAYFGPGDEERIMDVIGQHLPYEERRQGFVDRLARNLKF